MLKQVVIIAGGLATRLFPLTENIPKSMILVNGKPFFEHQIELCKKNGVEEIIFCGGHLWEQVQDYFGDGKDFGVKIIYSIEIEKLDTGGAIKNALPYLAKDFFILYGDSYFTIDWQKAYRFYKNSQTKGLMVVYKNDGQLGLPSQISLNKKSRIKEFTKQNFKPDMHYIEYGLNILSRAVVDQVQEKSFPISYYFDLLIKESQLSSYESKERFYEVGSFKGIGLTTEVIS